MAGRVARKSQRARRRVAVASSAMQRSRWAAVALKCGYCLFVRSSNSFARWSNSTHDVGNRSPDAILFAFSSCATQTTESTRECHTRAKAGATRGRTFGVLVCGLLHMSIVFASFLVSIEHHVSHHSHSCGSEKIGIECCA